MRFSYLEQIARYLERFERIIAAYRYSDTGLRIVFDRDVALNFEMGRGNSAIMMADDAGRGKFYQAPFDVMLAKKLNRSAILSVKLHNRDKILRFTVSQNGSYKSETIILQLEFTGKHTNAILLDSDEMVLEALRHIDADASSRTVKVGQKLLDPPPPPYTPEVLPPIDIERYLNEELLRRNSEKLQKLKQEKRMILFRQKERLLKRLNELENESNLLHEAEKEQSEGYLILTYLSMIKPYQTHLRVHDFEGNEIELLLHPSELAASAHAEQRFKKAKKAKQKASGLHQERANLDAKIRHLELFSHTVEGAKTPEEIEILFPQKLEKKKQSGSDSVAEFWIEGTKVSLGKNERGNIELLRNAKAKDIWLHLKDRPSAHVIISTDKQQLPQKIIETAAKLCVDFSEFEKGRYLVDYTQRREVKIVEGANVLYTRYKSISIEKD